MIDAVNRRHQGRGIKAAEKAVKIVLAIYLFHAIAADNFVFLPAEKIVMNKGSTIGRVFRIDSTH